MIKIYKPKHYDFGTFHQYRIINTSKFSISINKIIDPDSISTVPHDHACNFFSWILWGSYTEKLYKNYLSNPEDIQYRKFKTFTWHKFLHNWAHIIVECEGVYTLFITWNHKKRKPYLYTPEGPFTFADFYKNGLHKKYGRQDPVI